MKRAVYLIFFIILLSLISSGCSKNQTEDKDTAPGLSAEDIQPVILDPDVKYYTEKDFDNIIPNESTLEDVLAIGMPPYGIVTLASGPLHMAYPLYSGNFMCIRTSEDIVITKEIMTFNGEIIEQYK